MSLKTFNELTSLDYGYQAQPFCVVATKSQIDTRTLDYAYQAQPLYAVAPFNAAQMMLFFAF